MIFWSLACASHALADQLRDACRQPILARAWARAAAFPPRRRAVAEWFRVDERATAMGIINAGTAVGAVVAPPLIALDPKSI